MTRSKPLLSPKMPHHPKIASPAPWCHAITILHQSAVICTNLHLIPHKISAAPFSLSSGESAGVRVGQIAITIYHFSIPNFQLFFPSRRNPVHLHRFSAISAPICSSPFNYHLPFFNSQFSIVLCLAPQSCAPCTGFSPFPPPSRPSRSSCPSPFGFSFSWIYEPAMLNSLPVGTAYNEKRLT